MNEPDQPIDLSGILGQNQQHAMIDSMVQDFLKNPALASALFATWGFDLYRFNTFGKIDPDPVAAIQTTMPSRGNKPAWVWMTFDPEVAKRVQAAIGRAETRRVIIDPQNPGG